MTPIALRGEATAQLGDRTLTLALNNQRWCEIEELLDLSYLDVLAKFAAGEEAGRSPPNRLTRPILWGATREHHPEMSLDDCGNALMQYPSLHGPLSEVIRDSTRSLEPVLPGEAEPATKPASKNKSPADS